MPVSTSHSTLDSLLAYEATASYYDELTAHHNYELWLGNLLVALTAHGVRHGSLLDLGCGTGKSFLPMIDWGWTVTGVDQSSAMLDVARRKVDDDVVLRRADMRCLPDLGTFDLVWCLDDAINCLDSIADVTDALRGIAASLGPSGLCVFDANTLQVYRGFFAQDEESTTSRGERLDWRGETETDCRPGSVAVAQFQASDSEGRLLACATHRQRHHPFREIATALELAGLELLEIKGHGHDAVLEPLDEDRHMKAIFIARRSDGR